MQGDEERARQPLYYDTQLRRVYIKLLHPRIPSGSTAGTIAAMSNLRPTSRMSSYSGIRPPSALGSHRQSTASHTGYSSHAPSYGASSSSTAARQYDEHGNVLLTPGQARAFDKQAEYEGFLRVLAQSEQLAKYCAELEDSADLMADGGQGEFGARLSAQVAVILMIRLCPTIHLAALLFVANPPSSLSGYTVLSHSSQSLTQQSQG